MSVAENNNNDNVIRDHPKMVERWVTRFVDVYTKDGEEAAAEYAVQYIPKHLRAKLRPMIRAEFERRGWKFPK